ncbi:hypothetical protein [Streptomyces sp. NPDC001820]|uniref:hypothetical protein n=1 Tax=Streptomyces sp. NPDC001820 TaxID=3364613 RepID=UPI0036810D51
MGLTDRPQPAARYGSISFYSYLYYEYNGHQSAKDGIHNTPVTQVDCPPAPEPGSANADQS